MIEFQHVYKFLGKKQVLQDVNVTIPDGTVFGLIGANGSGKSTFLRLLSGIYQCDGGKILLDQEHIFDNRRCKKQILFISDEPFQFFRSTLADMKRFYSQWYKIDEDRYREYLTMFHLDEHKPLHNFSKGMKRQAFILLGLAASPRYLLLDEAFDGLDPMIRRYFKQVIAERIADKSMSVIISSHDLKEVQDFCDSFAMIENGSVSTSGEMNDALANIHHIQMAFHEEVKAEWFDQLDVITMQIRSKVVKLYVRGDEEKIRSYLKTLHPLVLELLPVQLEEMFIQSVIHQKEVNRHGI
ncbi:ABC transporter ATP-binding protein [bacterium c-19]|nr:ABC transporter ATP-binding protein [bacterium c-19]